MKTAIPPRSTDMHGPRLRYVAVGAVLGLLLALLAAVFFSLGRPMHAPDWVRSRVETRLAEALPGFDIGFGDIKVLLQSNGLARLILSDVEVNTADGAKIVALSDIETGLAPAALLKGQVDLRELNITGAFVTLRRTKDGQLGLAIGDAFSTDAEVPDLPSLMRLLDTVLMDARLRNLAVVDADALTLRYEDARAGRGWTIDGGRVQLLRDGDDLKMSGDLALLGGGDTATTLQLSADSRIGDPSFRFGFALLGMPSQDIATQGPALAWLGALKAPISGALRAEMRADGSLGPLNAALQIDAGVVQPGPETPPIPFSGARSYFTYDPETSAIQFSELSFSSSQASATAEGRATLVDLRGGVPSQMIGQFTISNLRANPDNFFAEPLEIARAEVDMRLRLDPFSLDVGRLRIDDPDLPVRMRGRLSADGRFWRYALDGEVAHTTPERVAALWPPRLGAKPRKWFEENVYAGELYDGTFSIRSREDLPPAAYIGAKIRKADVRYSKKLPPVRNASGTLEIYDNRLVARATGGEVRPERGGPIQIGGSSFVILDIRKKPARGELSLEAQGPIEAVLSALDGPQLQLMKKAGKPVDIVDGIVRFGGSIGLPLKKGVKLPDMELDLSGRATSVNSKKIVPGRLLAARSLAVRVNNDALTVTGQATLSGIPFDGSWTMPLPEPGQPPAGSTLDGIATLSDEAARAVGVTLPAGTIRGQGPGHLHVDMVRGQPPAFHLVSDLAGLGLSLPQIGWQLARTATGRLTVEGRLDKPAEVTMLDIDAGGLRANGNVTLNADGTLDRVRLDSVRVGDWLDSPVDLVGRGKGAVPAVVVRGGEADLRKAPFGKGGVPNQSGGGSSTALPLTIALDNLQISQGIAIRDFRAELTSRGGLNGTFTGTVGGIAPITGDAVPADGRTAFRIKSDKAGKVIRAAGILKTVEGGELTLTLLPVAGTEGSYDGTLKILGTRLRRAPGIAALLDAISIVGLIDQLEGPGILFSEVDARFRLTPEKLILTQSSATGPSMGMSMDGIYDLTTGTLDMQGVLSPLFFINGIGSLFTRKGEGLIGFNFNLRGPAEDPRVAVNPLSVFTPGMFREIFRRPPPKPSQ